jgi:hypothetical protein
MHSMGANRAMSREIQPTVPQDDEAQYWATGSQPRKPAGFSQFRNRFKHPSAMLIKATSTPQEEEHPPCIETITRFL